MATPSAAEQVRLDAALRDAAWKDDLPRESSVGRSTSTPRTTRCSRHTSSRRARATRTAPADPRPRRSASTTRTAGTAPASSARPSAATPSSWASCCSAGIDRDHVNRIGYQADPRGRLARTRHPALRRHPPRPRRRAAWSLTPDARATRDSPRCRWPAHAAAPDSKECSWKATTARPRGRPRRRAARGGGAG